MTTFGSGRQKPAGSWLNEQGLYETVREYGCPMMDDTSWSQSESGAIFMSPNGLRTDASWLPCTSYSEQMPLPGTCAACAAYRWNRLLDAL